MKKVVAVILAIMLFVPSTQMAYAETPKADLLFVNSLLELIDERYPFEYDEDKIIKGGIKGILNTLDPHSDYFTKEEAAEFLNETNGELVGIGVVIELKNGNINIRDIIKGSPAEKAGFKSGDIIFSINDESVIGLTISEVSSRIKGIEGTDVKITVFRDGKYEDYTAKRAVIKINPVTFKELEGNIAYLKIDEFSSDLSKYTDKVFKEMDSKGMNKLILDLRNNPGGLLDEAVKLSSKLVSKGDIVHIRYNKGFETIKSNLDKQKYEVVVLVNGYSASASEIVAGAIKDRKAGKLVGTRTYGKGTVQSLMPITDGSMVKLTIAEYLTPNKISINGVGIEPDYEVKITGLEDTQLKKAIDLLK